MDDWGKFGQIREEVSWRLWSEFLTGKKFWLKSNEIRELGNIGAPLKADVS